MKMNVDGSSKEGMRGGIGGLIRNNQREWVKGFYGCINPCYSLEAELRAMYTGLSILKNLGLRGVGIETDCLVVVNLLREPENLTHPNHAMVEGCKSLIEEMQSEVEHVMRERNKAADRLAKIGARQLEDLVLLDEYPHSLESTLVADIHNLIDSQCDSQPDTFRGSCDGPLHVMHQVPAPISPHPSVLEEELEFQHRGIQKILDENSQIVVEIVILHRDLTDVKDEIHRLGQIIPNLHAEKNAWARELIDRGLEQVGELLGAELLRAEVLQLRSEAHELRSLHQELSDKVQTLTEDITQEQAENELLVVLKTDIDGMRKDLMEMRRDFEITKKANELQLVQKEEMEKNLDSMAWKIGELRAEKLNSERRPWRLGDEGYGMLTGSAEMRYPDGSAYSDVYEAGAWAPYDHRGQPRW